MVQRVLTLVLLPCLLVTQSVAMLGQAHAQMHTTGHDPRPHLHTGSIDPLANTHDHHNETDDGTTDTGDSDMIVVAGIDAATEGRFASDDFAIGNLNLESNDFERASSNNFRWQFCWIDQLYVPPIVAPEPLYIRHLTILI